jgi:hypothetical protein
MTEETMQETAQSSTAENQPANELTLSDLAAMKMIIDIASQRGAFKPNEMMLVGQTYSKLSTFLEAVSKQPKQGA